LFYKFWLQKSEIEKPIERTFIQTLVQRWNFSALQNVGSNIA